jgi:hypothetical protein
MKKIYVQVTHDGMQGSAKRIEIANVNKEEIALALKEIHSNFPNTIFEIYNIDSIAMELVQNRIYNLSNSFYRSINIVTDTRPDPKEVFSIRLEQSKVDRIKGMATEGNVSQWIRLLIDKELGIMSKDEEV